MVLTNHHRQRFRLKNVSGKLHQVDCHLVNTGVYLLKHDSKICGHHCSTLCYFYSLVFVTARCHCDDNLVLLMSF